MVEPDNDGDSAANGPLQAEVPRRDFISSAAMGGGLLAGYGTLAVMAGRYLYPSGAQPKTWMFVTALKRMAEGESLEFEDPTGAKIVIARQGGNGDADDFIALSSVCPHLGCQVHWQSNANRFFCPCHNGVFDPQGKATGGPPAAAGQSLAHYPLKVE
ncbi:MAG TPA: ubiquinol-cytochrome c reductase iron-sulfur subunit, partial [Thermoguttaceae bacterium]|nr:ubiquinol-cytochrome c reductase iron-sulfur subunit [Thermoguttaceae bacterium]